MKIVNKFIVKMKINQNQKIYKIVSELLKLKKTCILKIENFQNILKN